MLKTSAYITVYSPYIYVSLQSYTTQGFICNHIFTTHTNVEKYNKLELAKHKTKRFFDTQTNQNNIVEDICNYFEVSIRIYCRNFERHETQFIWDNCDKS